MTTQKPDHWSSEAYQHSASFVPKLATKVLDWLDPQKDDLILDVGCGDGVLDVQIGQHLAQGTGKLHGIDRSPAMIEAAKASTSKAELQNCTFDVIDATELLQKTDLPNRGSYTKAFSNAALHWILGNPSTREAVFAGVRDALAPGATFAFEMGGLGNVAEMRAGLLMAAARHIGLDAARKADPWFFPDEAWAVDTLEDKVGGWKVERVEREWRPTIADAGGVDGWIRLMGKDFFAAVPEEAREQCIREAVETLEVVCATPDGGYMFSYVRLRVLARKL